MIYTVKIRISFGIKKLRFTGPCRADWIRTSDPYVPNVVRYRAALLPERIKSLTIS